jgi:hypothetical protein
MVNFNKFLFNYSVGFFEFIGLYAKWVERNAITNSDFILLMLPLLGFFWIVHWLIPVIGGILLFTPIIFFGAMFLRYGLS